jgi:hypothetical protein
MLKVLVIGAAIAMLAASAASGAKLYRCYARSPSGSAGWGASRTLSVARSGALGNCAAFTRPPNRCAITSCPRR